MIAFLKLKCRKYSKLFLLEDKASPSCTAPSRRIPFTKKQKQKNSNYTDVFK